MNPKKVTISDIADHLGIAKSSVSRALNNKKGVSEELRQKIINTSIELGYLSQTVQSSKTITAIFGDIMNPYYTELFYYMQRNFNKEGYLLLSLSSEYSAEKEMQLIELARKNHSDGLILFTVESEEEGNILKELDIPVVLVNRHLSSFHTDFIMLDNFNAGYKATMHLIQLGHKHIGFVRANASSTILRYQGYVSAMKNHYLSIPADYIFDCDLTVEMGYERGTDFLKQKGPKPTAMICANDLTAIGFIDKCYEAGYRVPDQLSVVGFDNILYSNLHSISLTTIDQNSEFIANTVCDIMLKRLNGNTEPIHEIYVDPVLIQRESTKAICPNGNNSDSSMSRSAP